MRHTAPAGATPRRHARSVLHAAAFALLIPGCSADTSNADSSHLASSTPIISGSGGISGVSAGSAIAGTIAQVTGGNQVTAGTAAGNPGPVTPAANGGGGVGGSAGAPVASAGRSGAPVAGRSGAAGAASGSAGGPATSVGDCPVPPAGTSASGIAALDAVNKLRVPAGAGCATFVQTIADGATKHCEYYAANSADMMCIADPHSEVMGCMGFTGTNFGARVKATGYTGSPAFEVMAFVNEPTRAVSTWVNSVWHRIPVLSPWVTELGYGAATRCDTIDFGRGKPLPDTTIVVYPYDTQTDIPIAFDGSREGPMPPTPSTGKWPSGPPISLYAKKLVIADHVLTKDGDTTPITHTWLAAATADAMFKGFLTDVVFMYPDSPLTAATKYRVHLTGTTVAGPLDREWTFTTH
jgi:uncharacterized protein YkwD